MAERFECTTLAKKRYMNTLPFLCFFSLCTSISQLCLLLLAQHKLTYTTSTNQPQQSVLSATLLRHTSALHSHMMGAVAAAEVDQAPLIWRHLLTSSSDTLPDGVDLLSLSQVCSQLCMPLFLEFVSCEIVLPVQVKVTNSLGGFMIICFMIKL